jgi:hypothetical protein
MTAEGIGVATEEPTLPPQGMLLTGVDMGGDYQRGTPTVHGLNLLFTVEGITVQGPEPGAERLMVWSRLDSASCRARARQGNGSTAMVLILQSGPQVIRFFLPSDQVTPGQAAYLDQALPLWLARYGKGAGAGVGVGVGAASPSGTDAPSGATTPTGSTAPGETTPMGPTSPPVETLPPGSAMPEPSTPPGQSSPPGPTAPWVPSPSTVAGDAPSPTAPVPPFAPAPAADPMRPVEAGAPPAGPRRFMRRRTLFVAIGTLAAVLIAGGVYWATNSSSNDAAPPTTTAPPTADQQLANSVSLRLSDLPAGWARVPPINSSLTPAQKRSQAKVVDQFATCLGMPDAFIGGLFGTLPQTDQVAAADSPSFATAATPITIVGSHTTVVKTPDDATADAVPFTKSNFPTCFSQFQNASAAVDISGGSAQTSEFTLFAPAGVGTYAYTTTTKIPGKGTVLAESIFIIGGRTESGLTFQTTGTTISSNAVDSAYTAMVQRVAGAGRT